jgi:ATP-binding protein involved in chromosome partitioning
MDVPGLSRQSPAQLPIIAVASGKGGVGKSSVAVAIGRELARTGRRAGLVDADIAGPDVPRMLGLRRDVPATSVTLARWARGGRGGSGLEAMEVDGLKVASAGFLMAGNQGLALGSDLGDLMLGRLIKETNWGDVEALVVDLPPGISFTQQGVLSGAGRVATILVVTPAEVSHLDTGRALSTLRRCGRRCWAGWRTWRTSSAPAAARRPSCTRRRPTSAPSGPAASNGSRGFRSGPTR